MSVNEEIKEQGRSTIMAEDKKGQGIPLLNKLVRTSTIKLLKDSSVDNPGITWIKKEVPILIIFAGVTVLMFNGAIFNFIDWVLSIVIV